MTNELSRQPDYQPVRRSGDNGPSPVRRIMALRSEALIDQARITAEVASEHLNARERMNAGYDLAMHLTSRAAKLREFIHQTGSDADLETLHTYIKAASTEAIVDLIKGERP